MSATCASAHLSVGCCLCQVALTLGFLCLPLCLMRPQSLVEGPGRSQTALLRAPPAQGSCAQPGFLTLSSILVIWFSKMQTNSKQLQEKVEILYRGG